MVSEEKPVAPAEAAPEMSATEEKITAEISASRPIVPAKSKSAKRRESRKRKQAQAAALENQERSITYVEPVAEVSEPAIPASEVPDIDLPELATEISPVEPELASPELSRKPAPKPKPEKGRGRGKKPKMPDLFASGPVKEEVAEVPVPGISPVTAPAPETETNVAASKTSEVNTEEIPAKPAKKRGRPKQQISAGEFLDAATHTQLPATEVIITSEKPKPVRKPRTKSETPKLKSEPEPAPKKAAKSKAPKKPLTAPEILPEKKKPGRKKKTQAES
jgi:hypothetical protein